MRNLIALTMATAVACGGTVASQTPTLEAGNVSVDSYAFPAPTSPQSAIISVFTDAAGTIPASAPNDVTKTFAACSPAIVIPPAVQPQNCWNTVTSAFQGATLNLVKPASGSLFVQAQFFKDAAATVAFVPPVFTAIKAVTFSASNAGSVTLTPAKVTETPAGNGVVIGSITSSLGAGGFSSMGAIQTNTFTVAGIVDNSNAAATFTTGFAVAAASGKTCSATFTGAALSGGTAGDVCVVTFTATSSTGKVGTLVFTISVNSSTTVSSGGAVAAPTITGLTLTTNNSADPVCTLSRGSGWNLANNTCPQAFALLAAAAPGIDWTNAYTAKSYFADIGVTYDVGSSGVSAWAQPSVSVAVACTNDVIEYPVVAGKPTAKTLSFNPGYLTAASTVATDGFWGEPGFTLNAGAVAPFTTASWTKNATGTAVCTFTVTVTNQGVADVVPFYANFQ